MRKKNRRFYIVVGSFIIFFLTLAGIIYYVEHNKVATNESRFDTKAKDFDFDVEKGEDWTPDTILFPSYDDVNVVEGDKAMYVALCNPKANNVNFKYSIERTDTKEKYIETDLIEPGKAVTEIPLPANLKAGSYPIVFKIRAFSRKDNATLNGTDLVLKLNVLKKSSDEK